MPHVIVIDDQSTSRLVLASLVQRLGADVKVDSYPSALAALSAVKVAAPDLVLTDFKMPGLNGIEFLRCFRAVPGCADVPVIMVTSVEDVSVRYEALESGATDFLTKPVDHHECRARCRNLLRMYEQQQLIKDRAKFLEVQVAEAVREIRMREQETILRLARAGEYRDAETGNHVLRMAKYSRLIAEGLGLPSEECHVIEMAAPMHDIGKVGIPDHILLKAGRYNVEEAEIMRHHTRIGYEILKESPSKYLQLGAVIALGHHERYDGSGYPYGLSGDAIPLPARVVAVADVFDALLSVRPYKSAWEVDDAVTYVKESIGTHFDPECADAFLRQFTSVLEVHEELRDESDRRTPDVSPGGQRP